MEMEREAFNELREEVGMPNISGKDLKMTGNRSLNNQATYEGMLES